MLEEIQNNAILTYNMNLEYLKEHQKDLFEKVQLFDTGLNIAEIEARYELEYKDKYFDIYDKKENSWFYNTDSVLYSSKILDNLSQESKKNTFKTFYGVEYGDEIVSRTKDISMLSSSTFGNAPIIDYVNRHLPSKEEMKEIFVYLIFGVGLGLHIPLLQNKTKAKLLYIIEPSLEIFRLSLFTVNYSELSKSSQLHFAISKNSNEFNKHFASFLLKGNFYTHYIKFHMFSNNCDMYVNIIQKSFVTQPHLLFSYDRELKSLLRTYTYARKNFAFIDISKQQKLASFKDKAILLLAAGPSLKKNIDFVMKNKDKFFIVAIYGIIAFLEENNIVPDFMVQYDESEEETMRAIKEIKNIDFFNKTIFLFSSHISSNLLHSFDKKNIFIFQAMHEAKIDYGRLTSPSIGDITYSLLQILGANLVYLLGLDMAFDPDTGKSHFDGYDNDQSFIGEDKNKTNNNYSLRKSTFSVKGNFQELVETLAVFKVSIDSINDVSNKYKKFSGAKMYNLSNGAFFDNVKPLNTSDINTDNLILINKDKLRDDLLFDLEKVSSCEFSSAEKKKNSEKMEAAYKLKEVFDSFYIGRKYSSMTKFNDVLLLMHSKLCEESACNDLYRIINSYFCHNIHYIFYFINLKDVPNPKKHIKSLHKIFYTQVDKIILAYIEILNLKV